jgi:hypothetical protein
MTHITLSPVAATITPVADVPTALAEQPARFDRATAGGWRKRKKERKKEGNGRSMGVRDGPDDEVTTSSVGRQPPAAFVFPGVGATG